MSTIRFGRPDNKQWSSSVNPEEQLEGLLRTSVKKVNLTKNQPSGNSARFQRRGREVSRKVSVYNLDVIISVGNRVKYQVGTEFRQRATRRPKNISREGIVVSGGSVGLVLPQSGHHTVFGRFFQNIRIYLLAVGSLFAHNQQNFCGLHSITLSELLGVHYTVTTAT